jgi:hypothetical protein
MVKPQIKTNIILGVVLDVTKNGPIVNVKETTSSLGLGVKVYYDAGYTYDMAYLYYDRLYSSNGILGEAVIPKIRIGKKNVLISGINNIKPKVLVDL